MDAVALAATIGGSVVALAGVGAGTWSTLQQRRSAAELADKQHEHEHSLARGARLFEKRAAVYEKMLSVLLAWSYQVDATAPIVEMPNQPEPPARPSDEDWRAMQARLRTYGTADVGDAFAKVTRAINSFFSEASTLHEIATHGVEDDYVDQWLKVEDAREEFHDELAALEHLASDELASL